MPYQSLVFGGTNFFGKLLVQKLIDRGDEVTILTRGNRDDSFGNQVRRLVADRTNKSQLEKALENKSWDFVFDQICFGPDEAQIAVELLNEKVKRYIFTSTASVYNDYGENYKEIDFDPKNYPLRMGPTSDFDYGEGKRMAESVFFQKASFSIAAARFPIVIGPDDTTGRVSFHINRISNQEEIFHPNLDAKMSFISSTDAADFLIWLGEQNINEPLNVHSEVASISAIIKSIEEGLNKKLLRAKEKSEENSSPYGIEKSWFMNIEKTLALGFSPKTDVLKYFKELSLMTNN